MARTRRTSDGPWVVEDRVFLAVEFEFEIHFLLAFASFTYSFLGRMGLSFNDVVKGAILPMVYTVSSRSRMRKWGMAGHETKCVVVKQTKNTTYIHYRSTGELG